jgi:2'-5' RNA ligase
MSTPWTSQAGKVPTVRLFLGLWPDDGVRQALQQHAEQWQWPVAARRVQPQKLHMTLHFLGSLPRRDMDRIATSLDVPAVPLDLELSSPELWPRGIAVLCPAEPPPALAELHARLQQRLNELDNPVERMAWKPHVTLARDAQGAQMPMAVEPVRWPVRGHVLVESTPGPHHRYDLVRSWQA